MMEASKALDIPAAPGAKSLPYDSATSQTMRTPMLNIGTFSPVNENGSFEFDRVLKSGYVQKRTRKIKVSAFCSRRDYGTCS